MRSFRYGGTILIAVLAVSLVQAQERLPSLKRQPVHGVPNICGRKIEQFVLLQPVDFTPTDHFSTDPVHGFPKGLFLPASEDAEGVFYHAVNGVIVGRPNPPYEHEVQTGGVYFSKTKAGVAYAYLGDARNPSAKLNPAYERVRKNVLEKFLVAQAAPPAKKPSAPKNRP
jgi:hypothetical protein